MSFRVDSDVSTRAESVKVRSILSLARVLEAVRKEEKEEGSEEEDECEAGGENDESEMPITPDNDEISTDLTSRTLTVRVKK
jgi:hypothetical protein